MSETEKVSDIFCVTNGVCLQSRKGVKPVKKNEFHAVGSSAKAEYLHRLGVKNIVGIDINGHTPCRKNNKKNSCRDSEKQPAAETLLFADRYFKCERTFHFNTSRRYFYVSSSRHLARDFPTSSPLYSA